MTHRSCLVLALASLASTPALARPQLLETDRPTVGLRLAADERPVARTHSELLQEIDYHEGRRPGLFLPVFLMVLGAPFVAATAAGIAVGKFDAGPVMYLLIATGVIGFGLEALGVTSLIWRIVERGVIDHQIRGLRQKLETAPSGPVSPAPT